MGVYARKTFGMFSGEEMPVQLRFEKELVGAVLDRLGRDVMLIPEEEDYFTVRTEIVVSPQFFAWVLGFGSKAKVLGPESVVRQLQEHIAQVSALYRT
jgi:predicted DNA-binding transcriptional regulator YafY